MFAVQSGQLKLLMFHVQVAEQDAMIAKRDQVLHFK